MTVQLNNDYRFNGLNNNIQPPLIAHNSNQENNKDSFILQKLLSSRSITLFSAVNMHTAREVIESLLYLEADDAEKPIKLFLNSPGGEVNSGFGIYDVIRFIRPEVKIICTGLCASIATVILLGAKKENRITLPNCRFLIHQPLIGGVIQGPASDIQIHADEIGKTRERINRLLAQETGQKYEKVAKDTDRDYWMTAQEALDYGLAKKMVSSVAEI